MTLAIFLDLHDVTADQFDAAVEVIKSHFQLRPDEAGLHAEYLVKRSFGTPPPFVWRQKDREAIDEFWRALRTIATIDDRLSPGAAEHLQACFVQYYIGQHRDHLPSLEEKLAALTWLGNLHDLMKPIIPLILAQIHSAPAEGQTNWNGVRLIEACRTLWLINTGKEAPSKGLNLASPFGRFVEDLFEAWDVGVTPAAAFKAWMRQKVPS